MTEMGVTKILKEYFGLKDGQKLMDFAEELKGLTAADKLELAELVAVELGVTVASK